MPEEKTTTTTEATKTDDKKTDEKQESFDRAYVEELRRENAKYRTAAKKAEEDKLAAEKKNAEEQGQFKTLYEKAQKDLEEFRGRATARAQAQYLKEKAAAAGMLSAEDIKLLDLSGLDWDEEKSEYLGLDEALAAMKASKPYLFKGDAATTTAPPAPTGNKGPSGRVAFGKPDLMLLSPSERMAYAREHGQKK